MLKTIKTIFVVIIFISFSLFAFVNYAISFFYKDVYQRTDAQIFASELSGYSEKNFTVNRDYQKRKSISVSDCNDIKELYYLFTKKEFPADEMIYSLETKNDQQPLDFQFYCEVTLKGDKATLGGYIVKK